MPVVDNLPEFLPATSNATVALEVTDRQDIHRSGTMHFAVHVLCLHGSTVFLQRRGGRPKRNPHAVTSTASGHIDLGDSAVGGEPFVSLVAAERAARRELHEELERLYGQAVPIGNAQPFFFVGRTPAPSRSPDGTEICNAQTFVFVVDLERPLDTLDNGIDTGNELEVEAMHAVDIDQVDRAADAFSIFSHPIADNFEPVWRVARDAARVVIATRRVRSRTIYGWDELIAASNAAVVPAIQIDAMRHGESYGNRRNKKLFSGWADLELTDDGRKQAGAVRLQKEYDVAFSSTLKRAIDTLTIAQARNGTRIHLTDVDLRLREHGRGLMEGEPKVDIPYDYFARPFPNAESDWDMTQRCLSFLLDLSTAASALGRPLRVLISAHRGTLRVFEAALGSVTTIQEFRDLEIDLATVYQYTFDSLKIPSFAARGPESSPIR